MNCKIVEWNEAEPGWIYHAGSTTLVERFSRGRLIFASLQPNGIPCHPRNEDSRHFSFDLKFDGESLYFGWEFVSCEISPVANDSILLLRHTLKPLQLEIRTLAGEHGFFQRRLSVTNTSPDQTLGLTSATPLCGVVWPMTDSHRESLHDTGGVPFRVGWLRGQDWGIEGDFQWQDIPLNTELAFGSRRGRSGFTAPFAIAHNNVYGGYFIASLAWSANWRMSFFNEYVHGGPSRLEFSLQPESPAPARLLSPGETIALPEVHFGLNHESFDSAIQHWHRHLRAHVLPQAGDGLQPVIYNHWSYMEHELSEEGLRREIDVAAETGAELFMVDAGWYADANTPWWDTSGDWQAGNRLPNDLLPIFDYVREKGLLCGLWVEIESAGKSSRLAAEHPDWFITRYGKSEERILDLAKPEVAEYAERTVFRLIDTYRLDMFRLDYNLDAWEGGFNERDGRMENTLWRHVEVLHAIFDRVRERYPDLQIENCASGGGRCDLGMMRRFTTTWISDWLRLPRTVRILNGLSLALPPEYLNRTFGVTMEGCYRGNLDTQLHVIILGHPAISGLAPTLHATNAGVLRVVKKYLALYKDFIRPFHREARVYHHDPVLPGADANGWCALEYVSLARDRAVAAVFRLVNAEGDTYTLRFRGLDPGRDYRIGFHPGETTTVLRGLDLTTHGLPLRLDTPLTSTLITCEAI